MNQAILTHFRSSALMSRIVLKGIEPEQWDFISPILGSSVNWQVGHILLSKTIFGLELVTGEIPAWIDLELLKCCYDRGSSAVTLPLQHPDKNHLLSLMQQLDEKLEQTIPQVNPDNWNDLVLSPIPIVKTRGESALFAGGHQMYHNGQIALIKKLMRPI